MQSWNCCAILLCFQWGCSLQSTSRNIFIQQPRRCTRYMGLLTLSLLNRFSESYVQWSVEGYITHARHRSSCCSPDRCCHWSGPYLWVFILCFSKHSLAPPFVPKCKSSFAWCLFLNPLCSRTSAYSYFQTMERLHQLTDENRNLTGKLVNVGSFGLYHTFFSPPFSCTSYDSDHHPLTIKSYLWCFLFIKWKILKMVKYLILSQQTHALKKGHPPQLVPHLWTQVRSLSLSVQWPMLTDAFLGGCSAWHSVLYLFKAAPCLNCPEGWESFESQCYYFSTNYSDWEKAREHCQQQGADLVKVSSLEEQVLSITTTSKQLTAFVAFLHSCSS